MQKPTTPDRKRFHRLTRLVRLIAVAAGCLVAASISVYISADERLVSDLKERTVNDVTQLNPIQVGRVEKPTNVQQVSKVLANSEGPVSIGGGRNSMGGQVSSEGSLHLDMRQMNKVLSLSERERTVTVQAGITWRDLQDHIDPYDLSIRIMQTYANFTVGGTLSVNAHGRYVGLGPVVLSVLGIKVVVADGRVLDASPTLNSDLFYGVIGGYGGLAVIVEATLSLTDNIRVERHTETLDTSDYAKHFEDTVRHDDAVVFHNADLHPPDYQTARSISWRRTERPLTTNERLIPRGETYTWTPFLLNNTPNFPFGYALRKHVMEPIYHAGDAVTYRNHEASYDTRELEPSSRDERTFVLREYFVPVAMFDEFVPKMREIFKRHEVDIVNVSVRHALPDPGTLLAWAPQEMFAFVVYYGQDTDREARAAVRVWTRAIIDCVIALGGTYYLPYQVHATPEQFHHAYPRAKEFFALKAKVDPTFRFRNALWNAYYPDPEASLGRALGSIKNYKKRESQTLLTVPEWYLVFNPTEYAEHLEAGHASDRFPFVGSVREYWSLYKKALRATEGIYPDNPEYITMLRVIGVSTAVEYLIKGAYENTIGTLARWTSDGDRSDEDRIVAGAHRAYSDLLFHEAWYEFGFMPWVSKIWGETPILGENFVRRTERKLAFSLEFTVKAIYAELIGLGAQTAYDAPQTRVNIVIKTTHLDSIAVDPRIKLVTSVDSATHVISIPRWGPFSNIVPKLAAEGVEFLEFAGNDDVALTVVSRRDQALPSSLGRPLFRSAMANPRQIRSVLFVRVRKLTKILDDLAKDGVQLEHIYDY